MPSIDQRVVQMLFDNKQFEQGVAQSQKSLEGLKKSLDLDKATQSLSSLEKTAKGFDLSPISAGIEKISDKFTMLGILGQTAMHRLADAAINAGTKMVKAISVDNISAGFEKYSTKTKAVQTIMNATKKPIEEVEQVLQELSHYTDETSYDFSEMVSSIGKFTSVGVDLSVAEKAMEGIANEAAVSGAGIQEANRAMYNFAQALSAGYVKLIDWKSIENANMATKEFKEELIKTAIETGKLNKSTATSGKLMKGNGKTAKSVTVDYKTFNETLSEGWLTSDVLIKTLAKYSDTSTDFGRKAYEAAQKALTYEDAIKAVKDAVSSGWMKSFELLFGNLEESIDLWTRVCNAVIEFTSIFSDARNELLEGWHTHDGYNKAVEAASNIWHGFMGIVHGVGDAISKVFPPITYENLVNATEKLRQFSETFANLFAGETTEVVDEEIVTITDHAKELTDVLKRGSKSDMVKMLQQNLMTAGIKLDKYGADGIFGPETEAAVKELQKRLGIATTGVWDEETKSATIAAGVFQEVNKEIKTHEEFIENASPQLQNVKNIVSGIASVVDILRRYLDLGFKIVQHFVSLLSPLGNALLNVGGFLGKLALNWHDNIVGSGKFESSLEKAKKVLEPFGNFIQKIADKINNFLQEYSWVENFEQLFFALGVEFKKIPIVAKYWDKVEPVAKKIKEFVTTVKNAIAGVFKADTSGATNVGEAIKQRLEPLKQIGEWIKKTFSSLFGNSSAKGVDPESEDSPVNIIQVIVDKAKAVVEAIKNVDLGSLAMFALSIASVIKMYKAIKGPAEFMSNIAKIPGDIRKSLKQKALTKNISDIADAAKNIAIAIGILAASVIIIANLDSGKVWNAVGVLAALSALMLGFAWLMTKAIGKSDFFDSGFLKKNKTKGMLRMAEALYIMAAAVAKLAKFPMDQMLVAVGALGLVLLEIVAFMKLVGDSKAPKGMFDMGAGLQTIAGAIGMLAKLSVEQLVKGVIAIGAILFELGLFLKIADGKEFKNGPLKMVGIGIAVFLLAKSLKSLSKISWEGIAKGLVGLGGVLLELGIFLKLSDGTKSKTGLLGMIGIGVAVWLLAKSLVNLSKLSWEEIGKGLAGLGGVMLELAIFMKLIGGNSAFKQIGLAFALVGMGLALTMFASSIKTLGKMNTKSLIKGVVALGAIFLEIAAFMKLVGARNPARMIANAISMIGLGVALNLIAFSLRSIGKMNMADILKGVIGIGAILLEVAAFMKIGGGVKASLTAIPMMIALGGSLLIFGMTLKMVAGIPWTTIAAFGVGFGAALNGIGTAMMFLSTIPISGAITAVANLDIFIANLALVLAALGGLEKLTGGGLSDWLQTGAQVLGKAIGGFIKGIIDPFTKNKGITREKPKTLADIFNTVILDMSAVMDNLEPFLQRVGKITEDQVKGVGNLVAIMALMGGEEIFDSISGFISNFLSGGEGSGSGFIDFLSDLVAAAPLMKKFSDEAAEIKEKNMEKAASAMGSFSDVALAVLPMTAAEVVDSIAAFISGESGGSAFVTFAENLCSLLPKIITFQGYADNIDAGAIELVSGAVTAFSTVCKATEGIAWSEYKISIADFLTLGEDDTVSGFADRIIALVPKLIEIGNTAGSMKFTGISNAAIGVTMLGTLCKAVENLGWSEYKTSIADFLTIGEDDTVSGFADRIISLLPRLSMIGMLAGLVNVSGVEQAAQATSALSAMANAAKECGWDEFKTKIADFISGEDTVGSFADKMIHLMPKLITIGTNAAAVNTESILKASYALSALATVAKEVPEAGGLIQSIFGENDIDKFGSGLETLGKGLYTFYDETKGIPADYNADGMTKSITALADVAKKIPNAGGWIQAVIGEKSLENFGGDLKTLGQGLFDFYDATKGIPSDYNIDGPAAALEALEELENKLEEQGGVKQWLLGEKNLGEFGKQVGTLGRNLIAFDTYTKNVDADKISKVGDSLAVLSGSIMGIPQMEMSRDQITNLQFLINYLSEGLDYTPLEEVGSGIGKSVATGIIKLDESNSDDSPKKAFNNILFGLEKTGNIVNGAKSPFKTVGGGIAESLNEGINEKHRLPIAMFANILASMLQAVYNSNTSFRNIGGNPPDFFASGIYNRRDNPINKFSGIITSMVNSSYNRNGDFYNLGKNFDNGLANGIYDQSWYPIDAFKSVVNRAFSAGKRAADSHSPSRKTMWLGEMMDLGLVVGLQNYSGKVDSASEAVINSAMSTAQMGLRAVASVLEGGVDDTITIRPVLDLSDIQAGATSIGGLFGSQTVGIRSANIAGRIAVTDSENAANATNDNSGLSDAVLNLNNEINELRASITSMQVVMDNGALVGQISSGVDRNLGRSKFLAGRMN